MVNFDEVKKTNEKASDVLLMRFSSSFCNGIFTKKLHLYNKVTVVITVVTLVLQI